LPKIEVSARFEPDVLKAYAKNDAMLVITVKNLDGVPYWCECDVSVKHPLSLAYDRELGIGRTRMGILKPGGMIEKKIKIFTLPNNFPDDYQVAMTAYVYGEDGAIAERLEKSESVPCKDQAAVKK